MATFGVSTRDTAAVAIFGASASGGAARGSFTVTEAAGAGCGGAIGATSTAQAELVTSGLLVSWS
jgi:hypothetical protein